MTGFASWRGVMKQACGSIPATVTISPTVSRASSKRSKACLSSPASDGEAIVVDERGLSTFELLRARRHDHAAVLCAFDVIEFNGKDLRWVPIEQRKHALASLLQGYRDGIVFNQHYNGDGAIIFKEACALGCEGIVSKRLGSHYRSGRVDHWLKIKNPAAPAMKREAEEDWGAKRWGRWRSYLK